MSLEKRESLMTMATLVHCPRKSPARLSDSYPAGLFDSFSQFQNPSFFLTSLPTAALLRKM